MRFEAICVPDSANRSGTHANGHGHRACTPVSSRNRLLLRRLVHDFLHLVSRDRVRPAWARCVLLQCGETAVQKAVAPARCLLGRNAQLTSDILVLPTISSTQDNPRTFHLTGRQRSGTRLPFQLLSLFGVQNNAASYTHQSSSNCKDGARRIIVTIYDALH